MLLLPALLAVTVEHGARLGNRYQITATCSLRGLRSKHQQPVQPHKDYPSVPASCVNLLREQRAVRAFCTSHLRVCSWPRRSDAHSGDNRRAASSTTELPQPCTALAGALPRAARLSDDGRHNRCPWSPSRDRDPNASSSLCSSSGEDHSLCRCVCKV